MDQLQKAIFQTLIYADIFDYPLAPRELYKFLITDEALSYSCFRKVLSRINANDKRINANENFYFLKGREEIVKIRGERKKWSQEKLEIAFRVGKRFKLIPWVKMVGITGALAMENSDENDDIDLIIVTAKKRLWLVRFFSVLLTELAGVRRRPQDKSASWRNKICLNMFLGEDHLAVPAKERNLFIAHEVCQVRLVWDKENTYERFLWENRWVKDYLPNAVKMKSKVKSQKSKVKSQNDLFNFLEKIIYKFQLAYMKPRRTIEKIEESRVLFHPRDCSGWVMREYKRRCGAMGIES